MTYNPEIHHRRSIRLKDYDYSQSGAYFVTVCAWKKECLFGEIKNGKVSYNEAGQVLADVWCNLLGRFPSIDLDEFVIMPNHVHGIVILNADVEQIADRRARQAAPLRWVTL
jgi:putative transposase